MIPMWRTSNRRNVLREWWNLASVPKGIRQDFLKKKYRWEIDAVFASNLDSEKRYDSIKYNTRLISDDLQMIINNTVFNDENNEFREEILNHRNELSQKEGKVKYESIKNDSTTTSKMLQSILDDIMFPNGDKRDNEFREEILNHRNELSEQKNMVSVTL